MGPIDGAARGEAVAPAADAVAVIHQRAGAVAGPGPGDDTLIAESVAVISATVLPSGTGGEVHGLELVDRLVVSLTGPGPVAVLSTDLLVRTGPGELVIVCPATAGQCRVMAVVDEIRATAVEHLGPGLPLVAVLSITVAFAGAARPARG